MKKLLCRPVLMIGLILFAAGDTAGQVEYVDFFGVATFNGVLAPKGSRIEAFDSNAVKCGSFTIGSLNDTVGEYGFMPVYRDRSDTPDEDEGADPGESIIFTVNGYSATPTGSTVWTTHGDSLRVDLDALGTVGIDTVSLPVDKPGNPGDVIRFEIRVANTGAGLDLYGVSAANSQPLFTTLATDTTYANSGDTTVVFFDIQVPVWPGDTVDVISYSVFSLFDTAQKVTGTVTLYATVFDTTTKWVYFSGAATFNGSPIPIGSIIDAYDPDSVLCGSFVVPDTGVVGAYGWMNVFGDKDYTPEDEGAVPGDTITFEINGRPATPTGSTVWTVHEDSLSVALDASGVVGLAQVAPFPVNQQVVPDTTIRFEVTVLNTGDGLDFYGLTAQNSQMEFQTILPPDSQITYVDVGATATLYFDIVVPAVISIPGDTVDVVTYTVYSQLDTTQKVIDSVTLYMLGTDVSDGSGGLLPGEFVLHQNYPNPFNPATTISFELPQRSVALLEIINILGRTADRIDLGVLPAGAHEVRYDASHLASGVYFYRLAGDSFSQTKKMVLLK